MANAAFFRCLGAQSCMLVGWAGSFGFRRGAEARSAACRNQDIEACSISFRVAGAALLSVRTAAQIRILSRHMHMDFHVTIQV